MDPRRAPGWTAGCTADTPARSCGWHPGPCLLDSWSPSGCWRCSSWEHNDLEVEESHMLVKRNEEPTTVQTIMNEVGNGIFLELSKLMCRLCSFVKLIRLKF